MPVYKSKTPTKDGRKYYYSVSWTDAFGNKKRYNSKLYKFRDECQRAEASYRLSINKSVASAYTFDELRAEYISRKSKTVKPTTVNNIKNCLAHSRLVLGKLKISRFKNKDWERLLRHLDGLPIKNHRRNRIIEYTTAVCNYARKKYGIYTPVPERFEKYNEARDVPLGYKMEFYTPEQFARFISVVDDLMYKTLFTLLYATGMRSGEALALTWSDVDLLSGYISITKTVNTKLGGKFVLLPPKTRSSVRTIKAPQKVLALLSALRDIQAVPAEKLAQAFVFGLDKPIPNSTMQKKKHDYYVKARQLNPGLPEIRVHSFRHSCASALINSGATIVYISKYLGHSSTKETLDTYAHFFPNESDVVAGIIDRIL